MEHADSPATMVIETSLGTVEYIDSGQGKPVLFVHGSPGGCDQGAVMGAFLVPRGFRVIALSRPGFLKTPLTETMKSPDQQADLELALMDSLGVERFGVSCWSGGGPSSYRLAAKHPERMTALVVLAGRASATSSPTASTGWSTAFSPAGWAPGCCRRWCITRRSRWSRCQWPRRRTSPRSRPRT